MQKRMKLKPFAISIIYIVVTISLVVSLMLLGTEYLKNETPVTYITSSTLIDDIKPAMNEEPIVDFSPVMNERLTFKRPYSDGNISLLQSFYDSNDTKENQEKSLILYENMYLQNSGADYGKEEVFEVLSIYPGTVLDVTEDNILGKIVEIQHSNNIIASYQCLSDVKVKKDDVVVLGDVIGNSGTCNISKNLGNHLHLEVSKDGKMVNPETIFDKTIEEVE